MSIVDPSDFCRPCRGKGFTRTEEYNHAGKLVGFTEPCFFCNGTGNRTVITFPGANSATTPHPKSSGKVPPASPGGRDTILILTPEQRIG